MRKNDRELRTEEAKVVNEEVNCVSRECVSKECTEEDKKKVKRLGQMSCQ